MTICFEMRHFSYPLHFCTTAALLIPPPEVRGASYEDAVAWIEWFEKEAPLRLIWHLARQINAVYGPRRLFELGSARKQWPVRNRSKLALIIVKVGFSIEQNGNLIDYGFDRSFHLSF